MKLYEIVSPIVNNRKMSARFDTARLDKTADSLSRIAGPDVPGLGAYASVHTNPRDPHEVHKQTHMPSNLDSDGYYQYIKAASPYMDSNPFLPRVYNIDIKTDAAGLTRPSYRMEKLQSYRDYSAEVLLDMGDKYFPGFREVLTQYRQPDSAKSVWNMICSRVIHLYDRGNVGSRWLDASRPCESFKTTSKKLMQALDLVRSVVRQRVQFHGDMHDDNFMIRGTPSGPQLVILDPVGDRGTSVTGGRGMF